MTKSEKRCSHCGGKFGLICYHYWGLRFCRKACKDSFIAKAAKDYARLRKWLGFEARRSHVDSDSLVTLETYASSKYITGSETEVRN